MKSLKFSCPDDLRAWVKLEAKRTGDSESSIIRRALRKEQCANGKDAAQ